jgi:prophage antirepressor-like protein
MFKTETWAGHAIRFTLYRGEWWAAATDVTTALNYRDPNSIVRHTPAKYKGTSIWRTPGGEQSLLILNEPGIYRLITRSRKPEAEPFQDWVFETIRQLRESVGLEGYQVFDLVADKDKQRAAMDLIHAAKPEASRADYVKAAAITNKAVANYYGLPKSVSKKDMTPEMLTLRERVLNETVELMATNERFGLGLSVSEKIYKRYRKPEEVKPNGSTDNNAA